VGTRSVRREGSAIADPQHDRLNYSLILQATSPVGRRETRPDLDHQFGRHVQKALSIDARAYRSFEMKSTSAPRTVSGFAACRCRDHSPTSTRPIRGLDKAFKTVSDPHCDGARV
jgi:hypothetical protein